MNNNRFSIIADEEGKRLDVFLSEKLSITRTRVKGMIEGGHVRLGGKVPKSSAKLRKGAALEGEIPPEEPFSLTPEAIPLDILYEDEYILAVNKPDGMVVHPSFGHKEGTLVNAALAYLGEERLKGDEETEIPNHRPGIVHRLDKGTTGVILIAKDIRTQEKLSSLFKDRAVRKTYRAIVEGVMKRDEGIIEGHIGRHPVERKKMAVVKEKGREALTWFKVIERMKEFTYVEVYPKTGRTHQIRVHLAHIGHPVVGDEPYGKKARRLAGRPLLHAYAITFGHPAKDGTVSITAPVPEDMEEFIAAHEM
ncbi:MAG: RluA family pseudouridine synthase [Syntrophobacterales bacterium]|jgi:23S rRNA pseudouridine1911/1915/1917 synthase|nr:RluA family pseudouridine synthase [Syntrophobacterales bacterium]